jgi:periplasmic protein TonB
LQLTGHRAKPTIMKKGLLLLVCTIPALVAMSQRPRKPREYFYLFDANWKNVTEVEKSKYLLRTLNYADTTWYMETYQTFGPLISAEYFQDKEGKVPHGKGTYYSSKGIKDSVINYSHGHRNGSSYFYTLSDKRTIERTFRNDTLVAEVDLRTKDSIDQLQGRLDTTRPASFTKVEEESEFPGSVKEWIKYLQRNMRYPKRALAKGVQGTVVIQFVIDKRGAVQSAEVYRSVEYSIDQEALRLIQESPLWIPAVQNGSRVKSYKRQPITFKTGR